MLNNREVSTVPYGIHYTVSVMPAIPRNTLISVQMISVLLIQFITVQFNLGFMLSKGYDLMSFQSLSLLTNHFFRPEEKSTRGRKRSVAVEAEEKPKRARGGSYRSSSRFEAISTVDTSVKSKNSLKQSAATT